MAFSSHRPSGPRALCALPRRAGKAGGVLPRDKPDLCVHLYIAHGERPRVAIKDLSMGLHALEEPQCLRVAPAGGRGGGLEWEGIWGWMGARSGGAHWPRCLGSQPIWREGHVLPGRRGPQTLQSAPQKCTASDLRREDLGLVRAGPGGGLGAGWGRIGGHPGPPSLLSPSERLSLRMLNCEVQKPPRGNGPRRP